MKSKYLALIGGIISLFSYGLFSMFEDELMATGLMRETAGNLMLFAGIIGIFGFWVLDALERDKL